MKRYLPILFLSLTLTGAQQALAVTNVSGILTGVTTFAKANSPYIVNANLLVDEGATLVIEPGTEIRINGSVDFFVDGSLIAVGTATDPIIFKATTIVHPISSWNGIYLRKVGNADSSIFDHCSFTSARVAVHGTGGNYTIKHCLVTSCETGFQIEGASSYVISDNIIKFCQTGMTVDEGSFASAPGVISANEVAHAWHTGIRSGSGASILGNYIHDCGIGVAATYGPAEIAYNKVVNSSGYGYTMNGTLAPGGMHHNLSVKSGLIGYYLNIANGNVEHNTSIHDKSGVNIGAASNLVFKNNCFDSMTTYFVKVEGSADVDISGNYWGTTDTTILNAMMIDYYDNFISGKGQILPVLTQPHVDCQSYTGPWVTSVESATPKTVAVTVSPNPFVNSFVIDLHGRATELTVFNMAGQRIVSLDATGKNKLEVDMSAYPAGMYHYRLSFTDHATATGKLIKQ